MTGEQPIATGATDLAPAASCNVRQIWSCVVGRAAGI